MLKGLETLPVRVKAQCATAATRRRLPGRHEGRDSASSIAAAPTIPRPRWRKRQMTGGGQMIAFEVEGGKAGAFRFQNALRLIRISNNLGDAKSIVTHPATTTHFRIRRSSAPNSASRTA